MHLSPPPAGLSCCPFWSGGSVVFDLLLNVLPIVCGSMSLFCCALLWVHSSFAIILKRKRKMVALLLLSYSKCSVALLHGAVGWSEECDCGIS